jgi:hypothetical protein
MNDVKLELSSSFRRILIALIISDNIMIEHFRRKIYEN